jgi:predicted N-acetyltransferase YhbS
MCVLMSNVASAAPTPDLTSAEVSAANVRGVRATDAVALSNLHRVVFGPGRFARTAYRVREGTGLASRFCRVMVIGDEIIAAIRFADITIGGRPGAVLLGPLAVAPDHANQGHGRALIAQGLAACAQAGIQLCLLVGDEPYYGRLGFKRIPHGQITLPGPVDPARLLALEIAPGSLAAFKGVVAATRAAT